MLLILFYLFVAGQCQERSTLDMCRCEVEDKMVMCAASGGSLILTRDTPGCHSKALGFWVTGEAVVTGCEFYDDSIRDIFIQRTTLSCEDSQTYFPGARTVTLNGAVCRIDTTTSKVQNKLRVIFFCNNIVNLLGNSSKRLLKQFQSAYFRLK